MSKRKPCFLKGDFPYVLNSIDFHVTKLHLCFFGTTLEYFQHKSSSCLISDHNKEVTPQIFAGSTTCGTRSRRRTRRTRTDTTTPPVRSVTASYRPWRVTGPSGHHPHHHNHHHHHHYFYHNFFFK